MFGMVLFFVLLNSIDQTDTIFSKVFAEKLKTLVISDEILIYSLLLGFVSYVSYIITHRTFLTNNKQIKNLTKIVFESTISYFYSTYYVCSGILLLASTIMIFGGFYVLSLVFAGYSYLFMWFAIKITPLKLKNKTIRNQLPI